MLPRRFERRTDLGEHHIVDDAYALHLAQTVGKPAGVRTEPLNHLRDPATAQRTQRGPDGKTAGA